MFKHILVPTDGSSLSEAAIERAVGFAASLGARLTAFHARRPYPDAREGHTGLIGTITPERFQRFEEEQAERFLGRARECCAEAGVPYAGVSTVSDLPAEAIIQAAERCGADLICMASHGRKGLRRLLMGSETHTVLTQSRIPVLIVRP